ncbi:MAG: peptidyl-prolyl cis-trans isomerase B (cyclophilin B) [Candidatus Desulfovibrio kirbyi]|uniref:Peptidyl-prolyl cis-trans isomerase n=1 Tax=Candidatus Desulfovibrio kirbyi TaxID=2696086 RepID=A0A6L2R5P4_9BACT|nr:MAG: peptidyl-prolyl cis-trans isomerase B (cyclophilin B) [Candidatus Desulfovibrio kirbyi]
MIANLFRLFLSATLTLMLVPAIFGNTFAASEKEHTVKLVTSLGDIVVRLDSRKATNTDSNFIQYVKSGHYDNTIFHRVIKGFMIQGGGFTPEMKEKPTRPPIHNEADNGLKNQKYTIAMARTDEPHSATAQFFINVSNNAFLDFRGKTPQDWGYAVFGKVISGQDVVDRIALVRTERKRHYSDVPVEPVIIKKAVIME